MIIMSIVVSTTEVVTTKQELKNQSDYMKIIVDALCRHLIQIARVNESSNTKYSPYG